MTMDDMPYDAHGQGDSTVIGAPFRIEGGIRLIEPIPISYIFEPGYHDITPEEQFPGEILPLTEQEKELVETFLGDGPVVKKRGILTGGRVFTDKRIGYPEIDTFVNYDVTNLGEAAIYPQIVNGYLLRPQCVEQTTDPKEASANHKTQVDQLSKLLKVFREEAEEEGLLSKL